MEVTNASIPDILILKPKVFADERGYFFESFHQAHFEKVLGHPIHFCQDNEAQSKKGVLRGLHYQLPPFAQSKLVRVVKGVVLDVVVDIRKASPTFGQYAAIELSDKNKLQLFIPKGFAHGYVVLSDEAIFYYKVDEHYHKEAERGIMYNDPILNIDWKIAEEALLISEKDKQQPLLSQADLF
jgi:dTDP-4-dehydrorhamnose 3,5-epimerase